MINSQNVSCTYFVNVTLSCRPIWEELFKIIKDKHDIDFTALTLTLLRGWGGRCKKNYLRKEEGREGGEKKHAQRARRTRGSNPGPAAC